MGRNIHIDGNKVQVDIAGDGEIGMAATQGKDDRWEIAMLIDVTDIKEPLNDGDTNILAIHHENQTTEVLTNALYDPAVSLVVLRFRTTIEVDALISVLDALRDRMASESVGAN